jgi:hypothetical protein
MSDTASNGACLRENVNMCNELVTKDSLQENVKKWVFLEARLKLINEKTKEMRELRNRAEADIIQYLEEKNMTHRKITITDGELKIADKKEYGALTYSYIEECLGKLIPDKSQVDYVVQYIKDNRPVKTVKELRCTHNR